MPEPAVPPGDDTPSNAVEAAFVPTRAELEAYRVQARRRWAGGSGDDIFVVMLVVGAAAIAAGLIAFAIGAVPDIRNPTVPLACALTFYLGRGLEVWIVARRRLRLWRAQTLPVIETRFTTIVDAAGIAMTSTRSRHWSSWSSVLDTTSSDGIIVFWLHETNGLILPRRIVSDEQAHRIFAFARAARAEKG